MTFDDMLAQFVARGASDIHLHVGLKPLARINGKLIPLSDTRLTPQVTEALLDVMCDERQKTIFAENHQVDFAYSVPNLSRFRVNLFRQRNSVSAVLRVINSNEKDLEAVNLPEDILNHFRDAKKGLVLITGPTGSGKSTTLARVIDEINKEHERMIVTIEDPIEFLHKSKQSAIVQREIGADANSFSEALIAAMRQDPDVIMIGEIRDYATASAAISAAQTGHLVFSTLHTLDTVRAVNRVIELHPPAERAIARLLFAESLVGIVSQRLLKTTDGKGRVAALEILLASLRIKELIQEPDRGSEMYEAIKDASMDGMIRFDDCLAQLYKNKRIDFQTGLAAATSRQTFEMAVTQIDEMAQVEASNLMDPMYQT